MVLERIALALVVRKPMATHLVSEEIRQVITRVVAAADIGVVGVRAKFNLTEQERVATPVAAVVLATPQVTLQCPCTLVDSSQVRDH
jgi:hypothetical protein